MMEDEDESIPDIQPPPDVEAQDSSVWQRLGNDKDEFHVEVTGSEIVGAIHAVEGIIGS